MTETEDDRDGPKWPAPARVKVWLGGKTKTDLNGRPLQGGRGVVKWDDRDGPKWPAPAKGKRERVKWDDGDGPNGRPLPG